MTTVATIELRPGDALVVVDVQRDFLPGGALAVPGGDAVVAPLNASIARFETRALPVFATRDQHPPRHASFRGEGGRWPPHCVAGTAGARFAPGLRLPPSAVVVSKATDPGRDAYSGFDGTPLHAQLQAAGCRRLFVGGLATDYCVQATVLDASALGYAVVVLEDAVAAVDLHAGDGARALGRMRDAGVTLARTAQLAGAGAPPGARTAGP